MSKVGLAYKLNEEFPSFKGAVYSYLIKNNAVLICIGDYESYGRFVIIKEDSCKYLYDINEVLFLDLHEVSFSEEIFISIRHRKNFVRGYVKHQNIRVEHGERLVDLYSADNEWITCNMDSDKFKSNFINCLESERK